MVRDDGILKLPKNTKEFYQVLKMFKENDPNRNGKKDEIPLTGYYSSSSGIMHDGSVISFYNEFFCFL